MDVVQHPLSSGHASVPEAELDDRPVALKLEISVVRYDDKRYSQNKQSLGLLCIRMLRCPKFCCRPMLATCVCTSDRSS